MSDQHASDVLIIGSGIAGLSLALRLAAILGEEDSVDSHVHDTVDAGAGLCHPAIVLLVAERGPACVDWLCRSGCGRRANQQTPGAGATAGQVVVV